MFPSERQLYEITPTGKGPVPFTQHPFDREALS